MLSGLLVYAVYNLIRSYLPGVDYNIYYTWGLDKLREDCFIRIKNVTVFKFRIKGALLNYKIAF